VFAPGTALGGSWPVRGPREPAGASELLQARGLVVRLGGRTVLDGIDLTLRRGEVVALVGESGSGKTTLLRVLAGHRRPDAGEVHRPPRRAAVQLLFQDALASMTPRRTVRDLLRETRAPHFDERFSAMRVGLQDGQLDRTVAELSGGERRRAALLRALSVNPELLLLDEPTASLDLGHQLDVQLLLAALNRDDRVTMVLSTHDLNLAAALCRHLILLRDGRVIAQGPTEDVLTPETVRALYGVDADVHRHPIAGHLTVTALARAR
jgi:iron complex transport system ATP-binding protein